MGKPAARLGDSTAHGTPLMGSTGSTNVFIGGMPAWRVGIDMHTCPLFNGSAPHVGGMVSVGSSSVFINNFPVARMGDQIIEAGAPNSIVSGEVTVMIG